MLQEFPEHMKVVHKTQNSPSPSPSHPLLSLFSGEENSGLYQISIVTNEQELQALFSWVL
jgi:hypothetical protein